MPRFDDYTGEDLIPPYRILDLTDRRAAFCGRLLADYGADVVKVEPPGGAPSRWTWRARRVGRCSGGWQQTPTW